ncbi:DASH family cryptochrome [Marinomonas sp. TW1]|uniref:DASH family cryptochrome n=1 Tax=Marinomonas sp. TW1 TaxID=1561203 RepID=UPI0007AFC9E2|nr:DASH family cryptochrome [Marinomonas sp. TW1]KZN13905.1 FAD-binding protein [Marinomonas sp. TW1]
MKMGLVWFSNDLRCADQKMLWRAAQEVDQLVCLFCDAPEYKRPTRYATQGMSAQRRSFLLQGLDNLTLELEDLGQMLYVSQLDPLNSLTLILNELPISHVFLNHDSGWNEQASLRQLAKSFSDVHFHLDHGQTLFEPWQFPFAVADLPDSFSKFRRIVETMDIAEPIPKVRELPTAVAFSLAQITPWQAQSISSQGPFVGGEDAAKQQLTDYFTTDLPKHYKDVRNALSGWENSTKFSAWLAQGSLSPRQILASLRQYETDRGANESTYWIFFELLWREYFHWYAACHGKRLFMPNGVAKQAPKLSYYPERFRKWCQGNTPYPIVNACMKQLNQTGFMSNRGRQLVASCLIYELGVDWRYGAAYFEQQLVDYDVGSNWGNWQYIAGVGADPRGGRRFNLEKQTTQYDPDGVFIRQWQGDEFDHLLDSVDAADWPLYPTL